MVPTRRCGSGAGSVYKPDGGETQWRAAPSHAWYRCAVEAAEGAPAEEKETESQIAQDARKSLTSLLAKLSPDQLGAAEQLARRYIENYAKRGA
jgi:hypothetical protein